MALTPRVPIASWDAARDVWIREHPEDTIPGFELLDVFSETFPTSGMTRRGMAYELPMSAPPTPDSASSSSPGTLLPTPVASEGTKPSNTMGVARRAATGEVFLTNVIVTLCGLDPTET